MTEKISQCNVCKESLFVTGNYSMTVLPSKRIPKKVKKEDSSIAAWGMSKFQKYLVKRSIPTNICEITCGTCQTTCKIPMVKKKKLAAFRKQTRTDSITPLNISLDLSPVSSKSKRKKKKSKEVNAGLIIPESFRSSSQSQESSPTSSTPKNTSSHVGRSITAFKNISPSPIRTSSSQKNKKTLQSRNNDAKLLATRNALKMSLSHTPPSANSLDKFLT